jgi:hypothetical protein
MKKLEGFVVNGQEKKICKLVKSLCGLKWTSKLYHEKFDKVMLSNKFKINKLNKCIYVKNTNKGYAIICLW